jgi:hypothetical protein
MQLEKGQFPYSQLEQLPDWYLGRLLGGTGDIRWDELTHAQRTAVIAENERRHPKPLVSVLDPESGDVGVADADLVHRADVARANLATARALLVSKTAEHADASTIADAQRKVADAETALAEADAAVTASILRNAPSAGVDPGLVQAAADTAKASAAADAVVAARVAEHADTATIEAARAKADTAAKEAAEAQSKLEVAREKAAAEVVSRVGTARPRSNADTAAADAAAEAEHDHAAGTVSEVVDRINASTTAAQLNAIEASELDGKNRKGVLDAVAHRRSELGLV